MFSVSVTRRTRVVVAAAVVLAGAATSAETHVGFTLWARRIVPTVPLIRRRFPSHP